MITGRFDRGQCRPTPIYWGIFASFILTWFFELFEFHPLSFALIVIFRFCFVLNSMYNVKRQATISIQNEIDSMIMQISLNHKIRKKTIFLTTSNITNAVTTTNFNQTNWNRQSMFAAKAITKQKQSTRMPWLCKRIASRELH